MAAPKRRVVITGIGVLNPLGKDPASFWQGLSSGKSGIATISYFDATPLPVRIAGEVPDFEIKNYILDRNGRKQIRVMARTIQFAVAASYVAMQDCRIERSKLDSTRFGVEFGAGLIPSELIELAPACALSMDTTNHHANAKIWGEQGLPNIQPLWMLKYLPNMLACHVSILHDAQGPNNSITESDVASLLALGESTRIIERNQADFFLLGGADAKINTLSMVRQTMFGNLSKQNETPATACKPFDRDRDGHAIGEGGGVLVAEDREHAEKRGAPIYGEIAGFGAAFDRGMTGRGLARAIEFALKKAGIKANDLDHVNAHGMGSPKLDAMEAKALRETVGDTPVWAIKGAIGNQGAGADTTEIAASLLAMKNGVVPATVNFTHAAPDCPIQIVTSPKPVTKPYFLKVGFTEMGQCAAVVIRCER